MLKRRGPFTARLACLMFLILTGALEFMCGTLQKRPCLRGFSVIPKFGTIFSSTFHRYIIMYLSLRRCREYIFSTCSCCQQSQCFIPAILLKNVFCTISSVWIAPVVVGDQSRNNNPMSAGQDFSKELTLVYDILWQIYVGSMHIFCAVVIVCDMCSMGLALSLIITPMSFTSCLHSISVPVFDL